MGGIGIFLMISALIVLFPIALQVRTGETRWRDNWGYYIFALGLAIAATADSNVGAAYRVKLAIAGVIGALVGLIIQTRLPPPRDHHGH
jgi:hypothetical protein